MKFEFNIEYHARTKRWSCNTYLDGVHHELKNFDNVDDMSLYMLGCVPPEAK